MISRPRAPIESQRPLYVVPCSARKASKLRNGALQAQDAYTGQLFKLSRIRLMQAGAKWCILSGWYGFIWQDTIIEHYDCRIDPNYPDWLPFEALKQKQYGRLMAAKRVIVLGGKAYADAAERFLCLQVERPFSGLGIGQMMAALKRLKIDT
jgi:hypothetical protein